MVVRSFFVWGVVEAAEWRTLPGCRFLGQSQPLGQGWGSYHIAIEGNGYVEDILCLLQEGNHVTQVQINKLTSEDCASLWKETYFCQWFLVQVPKSLKMKLVFIFFKVAPWPSKKVDLLPSFQKLKPEAVQELSKNDKHAALHVKNLCCWTPPC